MLEEKKFASSEASVAMVPKSTVQVAGVDAQQLVKLLDALEDLDDVQKVEGNFDIDAETMAEA